SREVGAVTGVSVLGALVYGQLNHSIAGQLRGLGLPASIQKIVITGVETGQLPASNSSGTGPAGQAALVQKVIEAAYTAFHDGLRDALFASAALVLVAGPLAVVTLPAGSAEPTDNRGDGESQQNQAERQPAGADRGSAGRGSAPRGPEPDPHRQRRRGGGYRRRGRVRRGQGQRGEFQQAGRRQRAHRVRSGRRGQGHHH